MFEKDLLLISGSSPEIISTWVSFIASNHYGTILVEKNSTIVEVFLESLPLDYYIPNVYTG